MMDLKELYPILPLLAEADPGWCIFGSAARWMDSEDAPLPHDIDIMMSEEGAKRAEVLLAPFRLFTPQPESGKWLSRRSHYQIGSIEIDLSGGLQRLRNGAWHPVFPREIKEKGQLRYCPCLE